MDDATRPRAKAAVLIFAEAHARDLRRRGLPVAAGGLLAIPSLRALAERGEADLHWFTDRPQSGPSAGDPRITRHRQRGRDFAQRLENAIEALAERGYERIVIVGRDCPQLSGDDVTNALSLLESGRRLVVGPDHRGGCWLIAVHASDRACLRGVRWRQNTDAAELIGRFAPGAAAVLGVKFDLDSIDDLRVLARRFCVAPVLLRMLRFTAAVGISPPLRARTLLLRSLQLPPPKH